MGGNDPTGAGSNLSLTEQWNGTSWTEVNDLNTGKNALAASSNQSSSAETLVFGGETAGSPVVANTEYWNGTSWTEVNDLATATAYGSGAGTNANAALAFGGQAPAVTGATARIYSSISFPARKSRTSFLQFYIRCF
jgi:hypothetical protein